jgi:hypothetical protein
MSNPGECECSAEPRDAASDDDNVERELRLGLRARTLLERRPRESTVIGIG